MSHKHKFIFIKTKKTAGTSVEIALSRICGLEDIITPINEKDEAIRKEFNGLPPQNYYVPYRYYSLKDWLKLILKFKKKRFRNHQTALEIKNTVSKEVWNSYFKFCFERNPYDKVISHYFWRGGNEKFESLTNYIESGEMKLIRGISAYSINGELAVDKIYKFEDLTNAVADISKILELEEPLKLPNKKAKSGVRSDKRHYRDVLSKNEVNTISKTFRKEIDLLEYQY